jgi:hypothetical protein
VKRRLLVCCSYSESGIVTVLKSGARIRLMETENPRVCVCGCVVYPSFVPLLLSYLLLFCVVNDVLHLCSHLHLFASFGRQQALDRRTYKCI